MANDLLNLLPSSACSVVFIILVLRDVYKAHKRKAPWIPPRSVVLGALTIQMLGMSDYSHLSSMADKDVKEDQQCHLYKCKLVIDCSRLTVCVFVSYLIPQMVRSRLTTVWTDVGALVLPIMFYMVVDFYFVWKLKKASQSIWFLVSSITIFITSIVLFLLLSCAVFAGKSISKLISQKRPVALSCCESPNYTVENHVLTCWIVTRASQTDYIMARSVFSALAGLLVLVSVVILVIKWTVVHLEPELEIKITVIIEFVFVLVGSMVVLFRWFTSVMYFPKNVKVLFYMEDFWTRSIADAQPTSNLYMKKRSPQLLQRVKVTFVATIRLHTCFLMILLQKLMVYLSKACWLFSEFVIGMIRPLILSREKIQLLSGSTKARDGHDLLKYKKALGDGHDFLKYKKALEFIRMPGESAYSLWLANEWAFNQTKNHIDEGVEEGNNATAELIKLIRRHKTGSVEDEPTSKLVLEEEKHLKYLGKNSWKMRANSLIYCMIYLYDGTRYKDIINDAIEACFQAWDFMDFIDRSDQKAELVSLAADKAFYAVKNIWKKKPLWKLLERKIRKPFREDMKKLSARADESQKLESQEDSQKLESQQDSQDWMREALKIRAYKTWKAFELNSVDQIVNLQCLLANVIYHCIDNEMENALIKNCKKWAEEGIEEEIYDAAFITGKLKGVRAALTGELQGEREKIEEGNDPVWCCHQRLS